MTMLFTSSVTIDFYFIIVLEVLIRITILQKRPRESDTVNVTYNNDAVTEMVGGDLWWYGQDKV